MHQARPVQLPPRLEHAAQRVRMAGRQAAEHAAQSLGLAAQACHEVQQRDLLLGAQFELNRKLALFSLEFNTALDTELARQTGLLQPTPAPALSPEGLMATWESLSLVDDAEVELHILSSRCAQEINHACGWELREFDAYMAGLVGHSTADHACNPLRAEVVADAMVKAVHGLCERPELRRLLLAELGHALAQPLRQAYTDTLSTWRAEGVQPVGLRARTPLASPGAGRRADSDQAAAMQPPRPAPPPGMPAANQSLGELDTTLTALLRRLQLHAVAAPALDAPTGPSSHGAADLGPLVTEGGAPRAAAANLISQHRDALRQATHTPLDHLVIDLVAGLFDQILSDLQVPPQFARQIARLQMPVLRAALGDSGFFSSRTHPVRQLVNRIATLAAASALADAQAQDTLLARVQAAVQAVVDGHFDRSAVYEQQLAALDRFAADQAALALQALGDAPELLARKEHEQRCQAHFAQRLNEALAALPVPGYLRGFMTQVWGRVIVRTSLKEGPDSPLTQRLRSAGRELVMSVQPKGAPAQRQQFLQRLPQLMKDLHLGLDHARCPIEVRHDFFARLLPAHAEALKLPPPSTLAYQLLSKQVEAALAQPVLPGPPCPPFPTSEARPTLPLPCAPGTSGTSGTSGARDEAAPTQPDPGPAGLAEASFTPAEAQALGLVEEHTVPWEAGVDIDLDLAPEIGAVDIAIDGLPTPDAPLPSRGLALAEHLQVGLAYQMQLQGQWQAVTLVHVSTGGGFYLFSHGHQARGAVSLTRRMLLRLCEAGRLRALENADLIARATARARQQLAELNRQRGH